MKKILSILAVAAIVLSMASCGLGGTDRYKDGKKPEIDRERSTVNGMYFDNVDNHCWAYSSTLTNSDGKKETISVYKWATYFEVIAEAELDMYKAYTNGLSGDYAIVMSVPKTSTECLEYNDK